MDLKKALCLMSSGLCVCSALVIPTNALAKKTVLKFLVANVRAEEIAADVKAFEAKYPDIHVEPILEQWNTGTDKFMAMVASGTPVDIISSNAISEWPRYIRTGLFTDLTPFAQRDKNDLHPEDFTKLMLDNFTTKGKLYCIPGQQFLACSIIYNATLLKEAGLALPPYSWDDRSWNWDAMVNYAQKLTKRNNTGRQTQGGIDFWDVYQPMTWATGGDWFDKASYSSQEVNKLTIDSPANAKAYTKFWELRNKYKVRAEAGGIEAFWKGKLPMWLDPQQFVDPKRYKQNYQWGFAPYPAIESGMNDNYAWNEALAIPKSSKHVQEAWTFVKWMTKRAGTTELTIFPNSARKSVWNKMLDYKDLSLCALNKQQLSTFIDGALDHARAYPYMVFPQSQLDAAISPEISKYMQNKISIDQALKNAQNIGLATVRKFVRPKK